MEEDLHQNSIAGRLASIDQVFADPPVVHYMSYENLLEGRQQGVWSTERSCYELLARYCGPGSVTLETGTGISTVLFTAWGAEHTSITPRQEEADAVVAYCEQHDIPVTGLKFEVRGSESALPAISDGPSLDLVLIDGAHGFPTPMIDWYYGAGRLRRGGILAVDDIQLPAVKILTDYLDADPRWVEVSSSDKWVAFERQSDGSLFEDWYSQPFYTVPEPAGPLARAEMALRKRLRSGKRAG